MTREDLRASFERAGDEHWRALVSHHEDAYPEPRPTPGDICRGEAERLNAMGYGDSAAYELVESRAERVSDREVRITHFLLSKSDGRRFETEPYTNYS